MAVQYKTYSAVFPIITGVRDQCMKVLLYRRQNTGIMDGMLDLACGGYANYNESASGAVARICAEKLGISVAPEDAVLAHITHCVGKKTYFNMYFAVRGYTGEPRLLDAQSGTELSWHDIEHLPAELILRHREALLLYFKGSTYSEVFE